MTAKFFNKPKESEKKFLPNAEKLSPEKTAPIEKKEVLPDQETSAQEKAPKAETDIPQVSQPVPAAITEDVAQAFKSERLVHIEKVLEEDLEDLYFKMDQQTQQKFKVEGEIVASKIEDMLAQGKIEAKKIFKLILNWLKIIPGVSKFFVKQESKIKTDKIINSK